MEQTFGMMSDPIPLGHVHDQPVVFRTHSWPGSADLLPKETHAASGVVIAQGWQSNDGWPWDEAHNYDQPALITPLTPSPWSPSMDDTMSQDVHRTESKGEKIAAMHEAQRIKRRDQNRTAQRAYRLRREMILKNLEDEVKLQEAKVKTLTAENERLKEMLINRVSRAEEVALRASPEVDQCSPRSTSPPTVITNGCRLVSVQEDEDGYTLVLRVDG